jgi:hypothetical protein
MLKNMKNKIDTILICLVVFGLIGVVGVMAYNVWDNKTNNSIKSSTMDTELLKNDKDVKTSCYNPKSHIPINYKNPIDPVFGANSLYQAYCQRVISPNEFSDINGSETLLEKTKHRFKNDTREYKKCGDKVTCLNSKKIISFTAEPLFIFAYDKTENSIKLKIYGTNANNDMVVLPQKDAMCDYLAVNNNGDWNIQLLKKYKIKNKKIVMKDNNLHILTPSVLVKSTTPSWNQLWE